MANSKVTKKSVLTKVVNGEALVEEEIAIVRKMIEGLEKRSSKPTKAQVENEAVKADIRAVLSATPKTAKEIADAVGVSVNKVASLAKQIEGVVISKGEKSKDPHVYSIAEQTNKVNPLKQGVDKNKPPWYNGSIADS